MMPAMSSPPVVDATRTLAVGSLLALIVLGLLWELRLAPTGSGMLALQGQAQEDGRP